MARPAPAGPPPPPIVQRLVIRYAKRGRMRFASHRDIARAMERGVRKAGLPVAYSAGFSPHPRISYAGGAPTGTASEAEYFEVSLTGACIPADAAERLDAALPDGIDVIEVVETDTRSATLRPEASLWEVSWPGVGPDDAAAAVRAFLAAPSAEVERLTSKGIRRFDARAAVISMQVSRRGAANQCRDGAIIRMLVRHLTLTVRPDDILTAMREMSGAAPAAPAVVTRLWQGQLDALAGTADALGTTVGTGAAGASASGALAPGSASGLRLQPVATPPGRGFSADHTEDSTGSQPGAAL